MKSNQDNKSTILNSDLNLFDRFFDKDFDFKLAADSEYQAVLPSECEVFSKVKFDYPKKGNSREDLDFVDLGLQHGVLLIFQEQDI